MSASGFAATNDPDNPLIRAALEQELIGTLIAYPSCIATLPATFRPEHYGDPYHGDLHRAIVAVHARETHWWAAHVVAALGGGVDMVSYLAGCLRVSQPASAAVAWANILLDLAQRRELQGVVEQLAADVATPHHERPLRRLVVRATDDMCRIAVDPDPPPCDALWFDGDTWLEADIPQRPWLAPGYFLRGSVTVVTGAGASGKSSLMCGYAVALALGKAYHRMVPRHACRVMSYDIEDDRDEQRRRMSAVLRHVGSSPQDIRGQVVRIGPNHIGTLMNRDEHTGVVTFTPAMDQMEARITAMKPDILMLDPLVEIHDSPENDNVALKSIVARCRALATQHQMAVVLLHHTRKGAATQVAGDPDSSRGASAIVNGARIMLTLTNMTEDEARSFGVSADQRRHTFRVDSAKANYSPPNEAEWFERQPFTLDNGEMVAAVIPWTPPVDVVTSDARVAIEAAIALGTAAGPYSVKLDTHPRSIKRLLLDHGIATASGQRQVLNELLAKGFQQVPFKTEQRKDATGLRTPDGRPGNVDWRDETDHGKDQRG